MVGLINKKKNGVSDLFFLINIFGTYRFMALYGLSCNRYGLITYMTFFYCAIF
jgi:hypothetical protein